MANETKPAPYLPAAQRKSGVTSGRAVHEQRQIVVVFQGGGALGAYQAGVFQALHEAGIEPDWLIGTSIGAINAGLIAGNTRRNRLPALKEFWQRVAHKSPLHGWPGLEAVAQAWSNWQSITCGLPGFFEPNSMAFSGAQIPLGADKAGYYSTAPLEKNLRELIDFSLINCNTPRLTVGATQVRTSKMRYFDSRDTPIDISHILASGALPPAFPAVRIDGDYYWDGGILSNTPTEAIFADKPRRSSLIFAVHLWNPDGPDPATMADVAHRQKDIQYSSRVTSHIQHQQQMHRLRHIIRELGELLPDDVRNRQEVQELTNFGCVTRMHVVRLLAPSVEGQNHSKDIDFSPSGIRQRWEAGYAHTSSAIEHAPWQGDFDPLEGVYLHEAVDGWVTKRAPTTTVTTQSAHPSESGRNRLNGQSAEVFHRSHRTE